MPNPQVPGPHGRRAALALAVSALVALSAVAAGAQPQPQPPTRPPGQGGPQIQPPRPGPGGPQIQPPRPNPGPRPPRPPRPPPRPPTPPPAPGLGLTLFSGRNYTGRSRTFLVAAPNLAHTGFNDHARSAKISHHGRWLVCSNANYRGHCVTLTRSVSDLNHLGLGHAVSSIRRQ